MSKLSDLAAAISDKSPAIKAFAQECAREVDALNAAVFPTPPPSGQPWPGYLYEVTGVQQAGPTAPWFAYQPDGSLRLLLTQQTPSWPATPSVPARQLLSAYVNDGRAVAGTTRTYSTKLYHPPDFKPSTAEVDWRQEHHTGNGQLSCALGIACDFPADVNKVGTNPRWLLQVNGDGGLRSHYGPPVTWGKTYDLHTVVKWSTGSDGTYAVYDGASVLVSDAGSNLFTGDHPGYGVYLYMLANPWDRWCSFTQPVIS